MDSKTLKNEVTKNVEKLATARDEIRLHLHLASMDAKTEWNDKLEPRVHEVEVAARQVSETSRTIVHELVSRLEHFVEDLRHPHASPSHA